MTLESKFAALGLAPPLLRAIADAGYDTPTPIQVQAIPVVLTGRDLRAAAQTGTGKTAGFTLPILQRLSAPGPDGKPVQPRPGRPRCLVLTPTRELAAQVEESVRTYGKYLSLTSMVMFGGVNINPQITALRGRVDILVATPGRLLDHVGQRTVDLSGVEVLVLDEADRMLDMGFIRDIRKVLALLPKGRQNLLFSATFSDEIRELADGLLREPASVEVARRNTASELVDQSVYLVDKGVKRHLLAHLIKEGQWFQVLVFTRTKHGANRLAEQLCKDGIESLAIHGNKSQNARTRALSSFKDGSLQVLVATDIAARGLDIDQLPHVVNFELPNVPEDYVHRIGRTGRAGSEGSAISLVDREETRLLADIERLIKRSIPRATAEGFVPPPPSQRSTLDDDRPPRPPQGRRGGDSRHGSGGGAERTAAGSSPARGGQPSTRGGQPSTRGGQPSPRAGQSPSRGGQSVSRGPQPGARPAAVAPVNARAVSAQPAAPRSPAPTQPGGSQAAARSGSGSHSGPQRAPVGARSQATAPAGRPSGALLRRIP
jgi:ATP-dependent RNA helicase RhlE